SIDYQLIRHPGRDAGCRRTSHELLRQLCRDITYAIVIFDRQGCGADHKARTDMESEVEKNLHISGWEQRSACIVIDPELEAWIWSQSGEVSSALGFGTHYPALHLWLIQNGHMNNEQIQPEDPKTAFEKA